EPGCSESAPADEASARYSRAIPIAHVPPLSSAHPPGRRAAPPHNGRCIAGELLTRQSLTSHGVCTFRNSGIRTWKSLWIRRQRQQRKDALAPSVAFRSPLVPGEARQQHPVTERLERG